MKKCKTDHEILESIKEYQKTHGVKLKYHHMSTRRGYISRKLAAEVSNYKGKFGRGLMICKPRWDSTTYHHCEYWLE